MVNRVLNRFIGSITILLLALMALVVLLSTLDLSREIFREISKPPYIFIAVEGLLDIFGMFLLVLIGIELLDTVLAYRTEHVVHEEVILAAALIAIARKVIVLDVKQLDASKLIGIGVVIMAVAAAYLIVKRTQNKASSHSKPTPADGSTPIPPER